MWLAERNEKVRQCPDKPGSVSSQDRRSSIIYLHCKSPCNSSVLPSVVDKSSGGQPCDDGLHELAASRRHGMTVIRHPVVSYTTFSPLPPTRDGGYFLLPTPTVTNSFYFRKWSALRCPDFPLASRERPAIEPGHCLTAHKSNKISWKKGFDH